MKLTAFDIQNYRSIIHTGWRNLSHDNITALIGQNESGKTSVLGALYSFYEGSITEDVLRSDLSLPAVSCRFELQRKTLIDFFDSQCLDEELKTILSGSTHGILTRAWNSDRSSRLYLANEEVLTFFERKQVERAAIEEKTQNEINQLFVLAEQLFREMEQAEELRRMAQQQLNLAGKELLQARRTLKRSKKPDERILAEKAVQNWEQEYTKAEADFTIQVDRFDKSKQRTEELSGRISVCKASNEARQELEESVKVLQAHNQLIKELDHLWQMASNPKEQKSWYQKLQVAKSELEALEQHQAACREADSFQKMLAWQVLDGRAYSEAVEWVTLQQELAKKYYSVYDLGQLLMEYIPVFEFFEDFSYNFV